MAGVIEPPRTPSGYHILEGPPTVADYLALRQRSGLSPRRVDQASAAVHGSWAAVHVVHDETGSTVGMGRVLGDGGWYFHIVDMAVLPEHQRRGLGDAILSALLDAIGQRAPAGAYVSLLADPPGRPLYQRNGFRETAPGSIGMARTLE
jgi:ribosomal protein S18 acetylase RimI-like enzyme